ncbi:hypothetical protein QPM05_16265, partial [Caldibacillus thermoamylovorans]|nr:hypothetical protein [Caldibacillus thermoamylovorans]
EKELNGWQTSAFLIAFLCTFLLQNTVKFRNWTRKGKLRIPSFCKWVNDYPNENSLNISLPK